MYFCSNVNTSGHLTKLELEKWITTKPSSANRTVESLNLENTPTSYGTSFSPLSSMEEHSVNLALNESTILTMDNYKSVFVISYLIIGTSIFTS